VSPIINSTCTYPQVMAALNAENPDSANQVTSNPIGECVAATARRIATEGRRAMVAQAQGVPARAIPRA